MTATTSKHCFLSLFSLLDKRIKLHFKGVVFCFTRKKNHHNRHMR